MLRPFTNSSLTPIMEAYRFICEDVEGKNINRAEKLIKDTHPEIIGRTLDDGTVVTPRRMTEIVRNEIPNVRREKCKFLQGVMRIYLEEFKDPNTLQQNCGDLNKMLKFIASPAHVNEYDPNLSGMSFQALKSRFMGAVQKDLADDRAAVANANYTAKVPFNGYDIVKITDFETAEQYGKYTSWCVTRYPDMFASYTKGGMGVFYFLLKNGFENVPQKAGEDAPFDEYGLSMVAVSVNDDGSLNTCTTRWNHDNGGGDDSMDTKEISELIGANFYDVFKPLTKEEIEANAHKNVMAAFGLKKEDVEFGEDGAMSFLLDFDDLEDAFGAGNGYRYCRDDSLSFKFVKEVLFGDFHDVFSFGEGDGINFTYLNSKPFDEKMKEFGLDFDDIEKLHDGDIDDVAESTGIDAKKLEKIEMELEDNFADSEGIDYFYSRCCESGTEKEAYNDILKGFFNQFPSDEEYGIRYLEDKKSYFVKVTLDRSAMAEFGKNYSEEEEGSKPARDLTEDGKGIRIYEPQYGWNGFDDEMWKEGLESFSDKVYNILSHPLPVKDAEGQQYFGFDKDYLDNPSNALRN